MEEGWYGAAPHQPHLEKEEEQEGGGEGEVRGHKAIVIMLPPTPPPPNRNYVINEPRPSVLAGTSQDPVRSRPGHK